MIIIQQIVLSIAERFHSGQEVLVCARAVAFEQRLSQLGSSSEAATSSDEDGPTPEVAVVRRRTLKPPNIWPKASTRARLPFRRLAATATATTCAMSPSNRA